MIIHVYSSSFSHGFFFEIRLGQADSEVEPSADSAALADFPWSPAAQLKPMDHSQPEKWTTTAGTGRTWPALFESERVLLAVPIHRPDMNHRQSENTTT